MCPTLASAVLGLPDHGRAGRRVIRSPFQGLQRSNTGWNPLLHALKCGGGSDRPSLDEFCGVGGCGTKGVVESNTEDGILFYMDDGLIVSRHP